CWFVSEVDNNVVIRIISKLNRRRRTFFPQELQGLIIMLFYKAYLAIRLLLMLLSGHIIV
ncbi:MAG TPA: hypothetical protein VHF44_03910, partial [Nitrososphaeraceae archaeon]|nr:hypothetical protein [Nitrososphaeraceae archaeon]